MYHLALFVKAGLIGTDILWSFHWSTIFDKSYHKYQLQSLNIINIVF